MMAVGASLIDVSELFQLDGCVCRLSLAAHISPSSVTLSGDTDAVAQAQVVFDDEARLARPLRMDTVYHSVRTL